MLLKVVWVALTVQLKFAGDNFMRFSGEATNMQKLQLFAWQSAQRGNNVHMQANPTAGELLHREFQDKKEVLKDSSKVSILAKYGGEEHLERMPRELLNGQTENCKLHCPCPFAELITCRCRVLSIWKDRQGYGKGQSSVQVPRGSVREQPHGCLGIVL